jgi:methionyl-tRNA formyltransferase
MQMDAGLDTGAMLAKAECVVGDHTSASLLSHLATIGPPLLLEVLDNLPVFRSKAVPQDEAKACYAEKILKAEAEIDWRLSAVELVRQIRAFNPFPASYSMKEGERIKIWNAAAREVIADGQPGSIASHDNGRIVVNCGQGQLEIDSLQIPGGKRLPASDILNARKALFAPGTSFLLPPDRS